MEAGQFVALGVMFVVLVVVAVAKLKREPIAVTFMKKEDGDDPLRRWSRGCYSILFGEVSPRRRGYDWCVAALRDSWNIHSGEEALATIQRISAVPTGHVAWDLVRVIVVARLAEGAGYITQDQAQAAVAGIQRKLQDRYPAGNKWPPTTTQFAKKRASAMLICNTGPLYARFGTSYLSSRCGFAPCSLAIASRCSSRRSASRAAAIQRTFNEPLTRQSLTSGT